MTTVTEVQRNSKANDEVDVPRFLMDLMGLHDTKPTVGWIGPALDFQNRTLNVEYFPKKHWGILRKRLAPKVKQNFNHYSGGLNEPIKYETVVTKTKSTKVYQGRLTFSEHYPEYAQKPRYLGDPPRIVHREITIVPVCETLKKLTDPRKLPKKKKFELDCDLKVEKERSEKKKKRESKCPDVVHKLRKENMEKFKEALVESENCKEEDSEYVSKVVKNLVDRRVKSAGVLYERLDKIEYNKKVMESKKRFKAIVGLDPDIKYNVSRKLSSILRAKRAKQRKNLKENQEKNAPNFLAPYVAQCSGKILEADNSFKLFLLKRRLTDYGISWKKTDDLIRNFGMLRNRLCVNNQNIPHRLKNLMRNILIMSPGPNGDRS
jgi:hypothetical protein